MPLKKGHKSGMTGKHHSEETKRKIGLSNSISLKGHKLSKERKEKIRIRLIGNSYAKGSIRTDSFKKRVSEFQKRRPRSLGRHYIMSEEIKNKISLANKGKNRTEETKKKMSEARIGKFAKEKHPGWLGGKSFEPYNIDWTNTLRRSIRERDFYTCQVCKEPQGDVAFSIHHIDYNKQNNDTKNLTTLCHSCHSKTNFNRNFWIDFFQNNYQETTEFYPVVN